MKFVLAYKDIVGATGALEFNADSIGAALIGIKQRTIDAQSWADSGIAFKTGYPLVLVDETTTGYVLDYQPYVDSDNADAFQIVDSSG